MSQTSIADTAVLTAQTAAIVSAYVANNHIAPHDLPNIIASIHQALVELVAGSVAPAAEEKPEHATPAQIRKSITPDALISFIDGKPYKTLKRHLTKHGLDPHSYRTRFGLPSDYPTTSASYSSQRAALARGFGLGGHSRAGEKPVSKEARRQPRQAAE